MNRAILMLPLVVPCLCGTAACADVVLVKDGKAESAIVLPENADELLRLAADELQSHVKKASGAEIPVVTESQARSLPGGAAKVVIGDGALARSLGVSPDGLREEEFLIKSVGRDLVILARDINGGAAEAQSPAHLWAVCWLLDRQLGVRWLWPGELGTVVPEVKTITFGDLDVRSRPSLEARRLRGGDVTWKRRHGVVGARTTYPHWDGGLLRIGGPNTHLYDKYGKTRPEIFAEDVNGKRGSLSGHFKKDSLELCLSNSEVVDVVVSEWEAAGAPEVVNACCADAAIDCLCPECLALDERLSGVKRTKEDFRKRSWTNWPNLSDRYVWFWNQLVTRMQAKKPNVVLCVSFYGVSAHPPKRQKLVPGILGRLVSPMDAEVWKGWRAAGAERIVFRPNWWRIGACAPYLPLNWVGDYLTAAAGSMVGMDHDALVGFWAVHSPNYYLTARRVFREDLSPEQILDEYCAAFGAAAPAIRRYLDYWVHHSETAVEKGGEPGWSGARHWQQLAAGYPPEVMAPGYRMLDEADALAGGDAQTRRRIEFLRDGLRQTELGIRLVESKGANAEEVRQFARDMTQKHGYWGADAVHLPQWYRVIPRN